MHGHPPRQRTFSPPPPDQDLRTLVAAIPLPEALKRTILEELLGGPTLAGPLLAAAGLDGHPARALTPHEVATLDAVTGRSLDLSARGLLDAVRRTRGDELLAWADLASVATRARVGVCA